MNQNIITLVCNKGGVGRSTTAQNVSWKLAELGYEVLVVDLDSQANTSITLALDYEQQVIQAGKSITNMLNTTDRFFSDFIINTRNPKVDLLASTLMLDNTENNINNSPSPNTILADRFDSIAKEKYHFIIFDTPPRKTDRFIHNALVMSNFYWYIVSAENRWSLDTKPFMDKVINDIAKGHSVEIEPIPALITKFRKANKLSHLVREQCQILFEEEGIMDATIRDTTQIRKASAMYKAIYEFDRRTDVAKDYESATTELIDYCKVHNK
jgi:chromosome partitioning protein